MTYACDSHASCMTLSTTMFIQTSYHNNHFLTNPSHLLSTLHSSMQPPRDKALSAHSETHPDDGVKPFEKSLLEC